LYKAYIILLSGRAATTPPQPKMRHSTLTLALAILHSTTATYIDDYTYPSIPSVPPLYLTPTLLSKTAHSPFYPYPTSSPQNCSSTYLSVVHGTASQGLPTASGTANTTYHVPAPSTNLSISTTSSSTAVSSSSRPNVSTSEAIPGGSTLGTTTTTTSQNASPTQSEPAEPIFTGSALSLPELQVWKWNLVVGVGLGVMVMWI
jgi:hypothetical protein